MKVLSEEHIWCIFDDIFDDDLRDNFAPVTKNLYVVDVH